MMEPTASQYTCPHCQGLFQAVPAAAAQTVACPHCGNTTVIQGTSPASSTAAPSPAMRRRRRRSPLLICTALALLLLAAAVSILAINGIPRLSGNSTPAKSQRPQSPQQETTPDGQGWADATKKSLRLGGFDVDIVRAELGPVVGRDSSNTVQTLASEGLQLALEIRNVDDRATLLYRSWYAESLNNDPTAELVDNLGNAYPLMYFEGVKQLRGHVQQTDMVPSEKVRDILIFQVPAEVERTKVTYFHLRLEASPLNTRGRFQFRIPISMVTNWQ